LFAEFTSTLDKAEALICVRELGAPGFMSQLVELGLESMMESMKLKVLGNPGIGINGLFSGNSAQHAFQHS
jgi:hypothetical protein